MTSVEEILHKEFTLLKNDIVAKYNSSGTESSGEWGESIEIETNPNGAKLLSSSYINGRGPGKPPPSQAIEQWIHNKGIASKIEKNISIGSLAFLIARKIARDGWRPEKDGIHTIIENTVTPQRMQDIINKVGTVMLPGFTTKILDYLKKAAV